jgi:hypothetical protein
MDSIVPILHRFHECHQFMAMMDSIVPILHHFQGFHISSSFHSNHGFHRSNTPSFPWDGSAMDSMANLGTGEYFKHQYFIETSHVPYGHYKHLNTLSNPFKEMHLIIYLQL